MAEKRLIIMVLIMSCSLIVTAIAERESHVLGPYRVSFDLGIEDRMDWIVNEPKNSESLDGSLTFSQYSATIAADLTESEFYAESARLGRTPSSNAACIKIEQYNTTSDVSVNGTARLITFPTSKRVIDGRNGSIMSMGTGFLAAWWVDNNTSVVISSSFPWDEGTLSLLKTIHIDRNATA